MRTYAWGMQKASQVLGMHPETLEHVAELAGLGLLAAYPAYHLYNDYQEGDLRGEHMAELAGLGVLAAPTAIKLLGK